MNLLAVLLLLKISVSLFALVVPFLLFPATRLEKLTGVQNSDGTFFRLYGMAILALLVAYGFGLHMALNGRFPDFAVVTGIVSNLGASAVLVLTGGWRKNKALFGFFSGIGIGLLWAMLFPEASIA